MSNTVLSQKKDPFFNLSEVVRLRKNDLKDKKKADKFDQIIRFAFQQLVMEETYAGELRQGKHDVIDLSKQVKFRNEFVLLIEHHLLRGGFNHHVAVLGNNLSVEIKLSRHSLMIFEICKTFQLLIYELPYINVEAYNLLTTADVMQCADRCKEDVKIECTRAFVADQTMQTMPTIGKSVVKDTIRWYIAQLSQKEQSPKIKRSESVVLGLIYDRFDARKQRDFNWHILMSDVHDPREAHLHQIHTNHSQIILAQSNIKEGDELITSEKFDNVRALRYHQQIKAQFQVNGKDKQIYVVIWNQKYEAVSSVELLMRGGVKGFFTDWQDTFCSMKGISIILFFCMIFMVLFTGRHCVEVNEKRQLRLQEEAEQYAYEIKLNIRKDTGFQERKYVGMQENLCQYQEMALGQIAVCVLVLAVLKQLIPRARAVGMKRSKRQEAERQAKETSQKLIEVTLQQKKKQ